MAYGLAYAMFYGFKVLLNYRFVARKSYANKFIDTKFLEHFLSGQVFVKIT